MGSTTTTRPSVDNFRHTLARAGDGAFVTSGDGVISDWNRSAERILGWTAREVEGRACCEVFDTSSADRHATRCPLCQVRGLARSGEPVQPFDIGTRAKAGQPVWLNFSILVPPRGCDGSTIHLFRDVTATKELLTLADRHVAASTNGGGSDSAGTLTRRELEVLMLLAQGLNTRATAHRLRVSGATVRNHVQHIFEKLGVHSRLEAVAYANRNRLV